MGEGPVETARQTAIGPSGVPSAGLRGVLSAEPAVEPVAGPAAGPPGQDPSGVSSGDLADVDPSRPCDRDRGPHPHPHPDPDRGSSVSGHCLLDGAPDGALGELGAALQLRAVSKRYHQGATSVVALDGVDLVVRPGELVGLVGRSGSGKSTLLHVAGGLDRPDAGEVTVGGVALGACSRSQLARLRRRRIGFVFQFFQLVAGLTVRENVALPLALDGRRDHDGAVDALLHAVGLGEVAHRLPGELSGGQMQRVAVARALVGGPALVLADEPTGNLDSASADAVLSLLVDQARHRGAALVLATHDAAAVARMDRVVTMRDGRLDPGDEQRPAEGR